MRSAGSARLAPAATMVCLRRRWSQGEADLAGEWAVDWGSRPAERACWPREILSSPRPERRRPHRLPAQSGQYRLYPTDLRSYPGQSPGLPANVSARRSRPACNTLSDRWKAKRCGLEGSEAPRAACQRSAKQRRARFVTHSCGPFSRGRGPDPEQSIALGTIADSAGFAQTGAAFE